jgi:hypothetical protein
MSAGGVSSYDRDARLPKLGSRWLWEIDEPGARALIEVIEVIWNGEEWWVRSRSIMEWIPPQLQPRGGVALNDLGRFWEAVTPVGGPVTRHFYEQRTVVADTESRWGDPTPVRGW